MADNIIETQEVDQPLQTQQPTISPEVAELMELSLNMGVPKEQKVEQPMQVQEEVNINTENKQDAVLTTSEVPQTSFFDTLREKFKYETPEEAISKIEELNSLKNKPASAEVKFENEFNEKLFKAIQGGKHKEVSQLLMQQEKLESLTTTEVNKDTASDIIKLSMQLKYKDLTPSEIEYKFNKQFSIPKEPIQRIGEDDDDFEIRKSDWEETVQDIEMTKIIEAKLAKPELEKAKSSISLPEIDNPVDEDYLQYKKLLEEQSKVDEDVLKAYKSFTPKEIETKINFKDEPNKIAFDFQYEPDSESFNKSVDMALNFDLFFEKFKNQDGSPDRKKFLDAIHFAVNKDKILMEAIKQTKNATIKSFLPDNSNGGGNKYTPQSNTESSEIDKLMRASLAGFMPK